MALQKNRGSKWAEISSWRDTLQVALNGANTEAELRQRVQTIINLMDKRSSELDPDRKKETNKKIYNMNEDLSFNEWFDIFLNKTKKLGYTGPIDKYTFESDWDNNKTPEASAEDFVKEMTD